MHTLASSDPQGDQQRQAVKPAGYESAEGLATAFGENIKAQMAAKTMFNLIHKHGDNLREVVSCFIGGVSLLSSGMEERARLFGTFVPCPAAASRINGSKKY